MPQLTIAEIESFCRSHPARRVLGFPKGSQNVEQRRRNALRYVATCALDLRAQGVKAGLLLAPANTNVDGFSADRLFLGESYGWHIYDIVGASEGENAGPSFGDDGPMDPSRFAVPPEKYRVPADEEPGGEEPDPGGEDPGDKEPGGETGAEAALGAVLDAIEAGFKEVNEIAARSGGGALPLPIRIKGSIASFAVDLTIEKE